MTDEQIARAKPILAKPAAAWTKDENAFIYTLIKAGHRQKLKTLRTEAMLDV